MASKRWIAAGLAALALALPAAAQDPKPGEYFEDKTDLGFKVRMPAKWESIPPAPDDGNLIIKFDPKSSKTVQLGPDQTLALHAWVLKFDRRKSDSPKDKEDRKFVSNAKTLPDWLKHKVGPGFKLDEGSEKDLEVAKIPAREAVYCKTSIAKKEEVRVYSMIYQLQPDVDVAVVFIGPGEAKRWSKYVNDFRAMAKSFKTTEVQHERPALAEGASLRDQKRAELQDAVSRQPGWTLYETPNYFIIADNDDRAFIEELKGRLEAIRAIYEVDYPAAKAEEIRATAAANRTGGGEPANGDPGPQGETKIAEREAGGPDSMEMSRCSIVRVCKNKAEYHSYGGPPRSAGYWSSNARELVIYDDKAGGGRGDTWITLNHEAFHQYIYYFYGNIAPHSWYNEGTGDFYSGYAYKNGRFTLKENPWRKETIKEAVRKGIEDGAGAEGAYVPFKKILRYKQSDYYSNASICYAQGWSMIYFLRTGKKNNAKGWDPAWDDLLENYLRVLAATGKPEQAIEQCLTGIDVDALEAAWIAYTK